MQAQAFMYISLNRYGYDFELSDTITSVFTNMKYIFSNT